MHQLKNRLNNGLISELDFDIAIAERKQRRAAAGERNLEQWRKREAARTWTRAEKSAKITLKLLDKLPLSSVEEYRWRKEIRQLVQQTLDEIVEMYIKQQAPNVRALFWYDVSADAAAKARALVAQYPGGAEKAPIQIL